jgi:hypothetical protein
MSTTNCVRKSFIAAIKKAWCGTLAGCMLAGPAAQQANLPNLTEDQALFLQGRENNLALPVDHTHHDPEPPGKNDPLRMIYEMVMSTTPLSIYKFENFTVTDSTVVF